MIIFILLLIATYSFAWVPVEAFEGCLEPIISKEFPSECSNSEINIIPYVPQRVLDWGSGGLGGRPWSYNNPICNDFFLELGQILVRHRPEIKLSPHDLFHAHIVAYDQEALAFVFHAKEYPADLEINKNFYQVQEDKFFSTDISYQERNYIYLTKETNFAQKDTLYLVRDRGFCHYWFAAYGVNYLSEEAFAKSLPSGHWVGDLNMFWPKALNNIAYNFHEQEEYLTGKSESFRNNSNRNFFAWLQKRAQAPLLYFLSGY